MLKKKKWVSFHHNLNTAFFFAVRIIHRVN
jgi:hypothetical protein